MSIITRDNKNFVVQISRILYSKKYHKPQQVKKEKLKKNIKHVTHFDHGMNQDHFQFLPEGKFGREGTQILRCSDNLGVGFIRSDTSELRVSSFISCPNSKKIQAEI